MNENNEVMSMEEEAYEIINHDDENEEYGSKLNTGVNLALGAGLAVGLYLVGKEVVKRVRKRRVEKKRAAEEFKEACDDVTVVHTIDEEETDDKNTEK